MSKVLPRPLLSSQQDEILVHRVVTSIVHHFRRKQLHGSFNIAEYTVEVLHREVIEKYTKHPEKMMLLIQQVGRALHDALPFQFVIGNIIRRMLFLIREASSHLKQNITRSSLFDLPSIRKQDEELNSDFKSTVLGHILELKEEISGIYRNICDYALEHVHSNEIIMTYGESKTVLEFLLAASRKRKFQVVVVEGGVVEVQSQLSEPSATPRGQHMASALSAAGVETILLPNQSVFAFMSRVNQVIVGTNVVLANGGLVASAGVHSLALAARYHSVPLVVCVGLYKLSPLYEDFFPFLLSPSNVLTLDEAENETASTVEVFNPQFDYVPPELISLFITNEGRHNSSYIYRLLAEYYHPADYNL